LLELLLDDELVLDDEEVLLDEVLLELVLDEELLLELDEELLLEELDEPFGSLSFGGAPHPAKPAIKPAMNNFCHMVRTSLVIRFNPLFTPFF
jgi:hypothetical protein